MTGFGRARGKTPYGTVEITLASVNKRGLEIFCNLPKDLAIAENALIEVIKKHFERGKFQLSLRLEPSAKTLQQNLKERFSQLQKQCKALGVPFAPSAEFVQSIMERSSIGSTDIETILPSLKRVLTTAIKACATTQTQEGTELKGDFQKRLERLSEIAAKAKELSKTTVSLQRERMQKNLKNAGVEIDLSDERILKELTLYADKVDITEELTRIASHVKSASALINSKTALIGRQLEFILQELLREFNTLGNKSPQIKLIELALSAKNEIERLREQAANIA